MLKPRTRRFNVAKYQLWIPTPTSAQADGEDAPAVLLESFVIRRLTGEQEIGALARVAAQPNANASTLMEETLYDAIAEINGLPVANPFYGFKKWDAEVRDLVRLAFSKMNDLPKKVADDFLAAEFPETSQPTGKLGS
jgi:hypothetical protein